MSRSVGELQGSRYLTSGETFGLTETVAGGTDAF